MKTVYHQSSSLSSIDEGEAEQSAVPVVIETEGELDTSSAPSVHLEDSMSALELASISASTQGDVTRRRRRRYRRTMSEDSIGSSIGSGSSSRRISYECHPDEILSAIAMSTPSLGINETTTAASATATNTPSTLPRRGMEHYRNNSQHQHNYSSMLSLIESDLDDSVSTDRENVLNVLGSLDEAILRSKAGRVRRSSSRRLSSRRGVLTEVEE